MASREVMKLVFLVPPASLEATRAAAFEAGAGRLKGLPYDQVCFETQGRGQFRPLEGAQPAVGQVGKVEETQEVRVEMLCEEARLDAVWEAVLKAHPYEEPWMEASRVMIR